MALVVPMLSDDNTAIPLGTVVVLDGTTVRAYDPLVDTVSSSFGVIVPKNNNVVEFSVQSHYYYTKTSPFAFDGYLRYIFDENENNISNDDYDPNYNWITDDACNAVAISGTVSVLNTQTSYVKSSWKLTYTGSVTSAYCLC